MPRRSGRYPWGSGDEPYQHSRDFLGRVEEMRKSGFTYTDPKTGNKYTGDNAIAKSFGYSSTDFRTVYAIAKDAKKEIVVKELIKEFDNVIFLGTFSKAYGLGGMRVGYGVADAKIIKELYKLRPPFNITTLSLEAASVALEDEEFVKRSVELNLEQMKRYEEFAKEQKIDIIESYTNFVTLCLKPEQNSSKIANLLLQKGMIVRDLSSYNMNAIRVTVGTQEQNSRFFELVSQVL